MSKCPYPVLTPSPDEKFRIVEGKPAGFLELCWSSDYQKFGVSIGNLLNPFTHQAGVSFKKGRRGSQGRLFKSLIILNPNENDEEAAKKAFLQVEAEFGIPLEASKYA